MGAVISFLVIAIVVLLILSSCIRIVPQAQALVVERLGAYLETWSVGVHFKVPFIDRVAKRVILKEQVVDFAPQPVITQITVFRYQKRRHQLRDAGWIILRIRILGKQELVVRRIIEHCALRCHRRLSCIL